MFNAILLKSKGARFDRVRLRQDFDVILYMLERGYPNRVIFKYAFGQTSGSKGGCSAYRTPELMEKEAYKLKKLHGPKVVSVVTKTTKGGWDGMEDVNGMKQRKDVIIQWKRAFKPKGPKKGSGILGLLGGSDGN